MISDPYGDPTAPMNKDSESTSDLENTPNDKSPDSTSESLDKSSKSISLSPEIISQAGLNVFKPGDVIYAPTKIEIEGDDKGTITGICITALGTPMDTPPDEDSLVDISESSKVDDSPDANDTSSGEDATTTDGSDDEFNGNEASDEDDAETKMLGYKRPKTAKSKMPKAKDFLFGEG